MMNLLKRLMLTILNFWKMIDRYYHCFLKTEDDVIDQLLYSSTNEEECKNYAQSVNNQLQEEGKYSSNFFFAYYQPWLKPHLILRQNRRFML